MLHFTDPNAYNKPEVPKCVLQCLRTAHSQGCHKMSPCSLLPVSVGTAILDHMKSYEIWALHSWILDFMRFKKAAASSAMLRGCDTGKLENHYNID